MKEEVGICLSSNGDLNLNTSLDVDDDLLDGLGGGEEAETDISFHSSFPFSLSS